jgi:hypothetical protein
MGVQGDPGGHEGAVAWRVSLSSPEIGGQITWSARVWVAKQGKIRPMHSAQLIRCGPPRRLAILRGVFATGGAQTVLQSATIHAAISAAFVLLHLDSRCASRAPTGSKHAFPARTNYDPELAPHVALVFSCVGFHRVRSAVGLIKTIK